MTRRTLLWVVLCVGWTAAARAQNGVQATAARRMGLERLWFTQVEVDRSRGQVAAMMLHVSPKNAYTVWELKWPGGKSRFSERDLNNKGEMIGPDEAKKLATKKSTSLDQAGLEPKLEERQVPDVTLFVTTTRGLVQAIDAETGRTRWTTVVGNPNYPTLDIGANDTYVATVNGSTLYVMDRKEGRPIWNRRVVGTPGAGPAITEELVHVPMTSGMLESYQIKEYRKPPLLIQSHGRAMTQPLATEMSVAWPTDRGHFNVGNANRRGTRYRMEASDRIVSPGVFFPPVSLFVGSVDGYVFHIHEGSGGLLWRFSTGEPISQAPLATKDRVFVNCDDGGLFAIAPDSGQELWFQGKVARMVAATKDRLYAISDLNRLLVFDARSGGRIGMLPTEMYDMPFTNYFTDRIYLATRSGIVQCVREIGAEWPLAHSGAVEEAKKPKDVEQGDAPGKPAQPGQPPADPADPFGGGGGANPPPAAPPAGGGADPFGGGGADPFGGGAKPAAPGGGAAPADPFGG